MPPKTTRSVSCLHLPDLRVIFIYILLHDLWDAFICILAVLSIIFGIQSVNQGNRNRPMKPIQQEYTGQEERELVLLCNKQIVEIHCQQKNYYTVEAQKESQET